MIGSQNCESREDVSYLRTRISQAYFCNPYLAHKPFVPASIRLEDRDREPQPGEVCWLDELLKGGIALPKLEKEEPRRPVTILLTGPPGGGKSTLALELCYRLSLPDAAQKAISSLYITSEAKGSWAIIKAGSYGWDKEKFKEARDLQDLDSLDHPLVTVLETLDFNYYLGGDLEDDALHFLKELLKVDLGLIPSILAVTGKEMREDQVETQLREAIESIENLSPKMLVVDSVNTVEPDAQGKLYRKFMDLGRLGPKIVVIILDAEPGRRTREFWSYTADIVIRLDRKNMLDYTTRTIEIEKARYQPHVEGQHQLKVYPKTIVDKLSAPFERERAHPYREEGGIFIYPSIHYYLSVYKRRTPSVRPSRFHPPIKSLMQILREGFPDGRCTGFIGGRGGHKSHLGYLCLLQKIIHGGRNERSLIISLRDDEGVARGTLEQILMQEFPKIDSKDEAKTKLQDLEQSGKLEILYYPPGFITPEEFFHRMYMSMHWLRRSETDGREPGPEGNPVTVLFNSLDQLGARFPLCAEQRSFVPGIVETLNAEGITSFFIAVQEPGQPDEQYGLLSMADALLSFDHFSFMRDVYFDILRNHKSNLSQEEPAGIGEQHQAVVMRVVRFAGGQAAGAGGLLELVSEDNSALMKLYDRPGLHFSPFSPPYSVPPGAWAGAQHAHRSSSSD